MTKNTIFLPGQQGEWGSYISKYQPDSQKVLDNMFTSGSKNFVTDQTGMIDKRQGGVIWNRTSFGEAARDSYEAVFENGARHFLRVGNGVLSASTGTGLFDVITSGYSPIGYFEWATYQDRVYGCNGVNPPQTYDIVTSYGGVTYSFTTGKTKVMGAQAPVSAPTAGAATAGGSVPVGSHRYKITFMYYGSEESNGSPASVAQAATSGFQTIPLTAIPIGGYGVTARNIYRDNNDGVYLLLDTINDNTTTTYTDTLAQGSTPTPIPIFNDTPPTFNKIALWLDSLWITPTGETNIVRFSNAGQPDIFDPDNFIRCQSDDIITSIYVYNGKLYVWGLHSFGSIEGTTPDTFYYHNISNNIGCVDNRSIQIRSIVSVPTLWWLSDKGIYYSNGYTVEYGSDFLQDLVNLNLAQVNYSVNRNTQTSFADFSGDTRSQGIDIVSQPGAVTTIDPKADFSVQADWEGGSLVTNLKTKDGDLAEVPTRFSPALTAGQVNGSAEIVGTNLDLHLPTPFTGEGHGWNNTTTQPKVGGFSGAVAIADTLANPIIPVRSGTVTSVSMQVQQVDGPGTPMARAQIYSDSGGQPGSPIYTFSPDQLAGGLNQQPSWTGSFHLTGGVKYWIVFTGFRDTSPTVTNQFHFVGVPAGNAQFSGGVAWAKRQNGPNTWGPAFQENETTPLTAIVGGYGYVTDPVAATGQWLSPVFDCGAISSVPDFYSETGSYPSATSATITVYTSASSNMSSPNTQVISNPNGNTSLTLTGLRYWQFVVQLDTTDDRITPTVGTPYMNFNITAVWVSQPIHATTDNTGWGTLTFTGNVPLGTTITLEVATSTNNITYSSFGPIGMAAVTEWVKVRMTLTATSDDLTSPSISDVVLTWNLTSTIESSPIDTGTTPAGFGTVQWEETDLTAGTVTFYIRTATTSLGLSSATYVQVNNGAFPNLSPLRFVQWKMVLMSTVDDAPVITSITVNWFVGSNTTGVRCASIFFNKTYKLSVATIGSTFNNILIELDQFGKWRLQKDTSVGTLLLYFNTLYFTDGTNGNIYNGFIANTDNGAAIAMDVRTKAWAAPTDIFLKVPRALKVTGINTGTLIHAYYSIDRGASWIEMLNETGSTGFQTGADLSEFVCLFVPDGTSLVSGRTLMYRVTSVDILPCSIAKLEPSMYTRKARYLSNV